MSEPASVQEPLTVQPTFSDVIELFDNEGFFPDIEFHIPGLEKVLLLNAPILARASVMLTALLQAKTSTFGKYNPETHKLEWMFDKSATDEKYRCCLVKWLRFCYGEAQTFRVDELSASLASLIQLQLKCEDSVKETIETYMVKVCKGDVSAGCQILLECARVYEETRHEGMTSANGVLAKTVLCRDNLVSHPELVIDKCLMLLPYAYLDVAEYGDPHSELSDFNVRMRYIEEHDSALSIEDKRHILSHVKLGELASEEMKRLGSTHILDYDAFIEVCVKLLKLKEKTPTEKTEALESSSSSISDIPTGHNDAYYCGAICHNKQNIIISMSHGSNSCRDVFVTRLGDRTTETKKGLIPFSTKYHAPVYDGTQHVYLMETCEGGDGVKFGRIDLDTFGFEELPSLFGKQFSMGFSGCFHNGSVYAVVNTTDLCCYNVRNRKWSCCGIKLPVVGFALVRLLNNPNNKSQHFFMMGCGSKSGLYRIDLDKRSVDLISSPPACYDDNFHDALLIETESDKYVIVATNGGAWYYYSFKKTSWTPLANWKPVKGDWRNYLVFSQHAQSFYYHIDKEDKWETVHI